MTLNEKSDFDIRQEIIVIIIICMWQILGDKKMFLIVIYYYIVTTANIAILITVMDITSSTFSEWQVSTRRGGGFAAPPVGGTQFRGLTQFPREG